MTIRVVFSEAGQSAFAVGERSRDAASIIAAELERPDDELDYARAKLAFDRFIDPATDAEAVETELDRLTETARQLAGPSSNPDAKLAALRRSLYESGPWNGGRPFAYDQADPEGRHLPNALLHNYLRRRLGQCVSMPILFLILAERLGLEVALALAPEHLFVRYTDVGGRTINLETTSGAHPARDIWFRQNSEISDRAVETGLYLRNLSKREAIASMAHTVLVHLARSRRFEEIVEAGKVLLEQHPRDAPTLLSVGSAYGKLFEQFRDQFPGPHALGPSDREQLARLMRGNVRLFETAENLGWRPPEGVTV